MAFILHAHLPDCRRPAQMASLEESWFFEAMTGTYLPLLEMLERLACDGVPARLTLSLSPPLLLMFDDPALLRRCRLHFDDMEALARDDEREGPAPLRDTAAFVAGVFKKARQALEAVTQNGGMARAFMRFQEAGLLELATTAASHAFFPAHQTSPKVIHEQIAVGLDVFRRHFARGPRFFWLPECGYFPGLDAILAQHDIESFALEENGIRAATPPARSTHLPMQCPGGTIALGRNASLSARVWSPDSGYPGRAVYREFHRDHVHAWDAAAVADAIGHPPRTHLAGLKYWRVTGRREEKEPYDPAHASARAQADAQDFVATLMRETPPGICVLPFDAELFGHWWFEGPQWLEAVLRLLATDGVCEAATVSGALEKAPARQHGTPAASTWGHRANNSFWVTHETAWIYPELAVHGDRLRALLKESPSIAPPSLRERALQRSAQLLLLAQASDWPFMISAGPLAALAQSRLRHLITAADRLLTMVENDAIDETTVSALESAEPAFGQVDLTR
ncbi:MAG: 1,4-alpha-glucan branching protein domain-containing protein, partial [Opitutaceae bacterium]